jgi:hypothetical protein
MLVFVFSYHDGRRDVPVLVPEPRMRIAQVEWRSSDPPEKMGGCFCPVEPTYRGLFEILDGLIPVDSDCLMEE